MKQLIHDILSLGNLNEKIKKRAEDIDDPELKRLLSLFDQCIANLREDVAYIDSTLSRVLKYLIYQDKQPSCDNPSPNQQDIKKLWLM